MLGIRFSRLLLEALIFALALGALCMSFWTCLPCLSFRRKGEQDQWKIHQLREHLPIAADVLVASVPAKTNPTTRKATKYLFVQHFPEHLGHAADSIRALLALGKALNRTLVAPIVQNARLYGMANALGETERPLHYYFDGYHLNSTMDMAGMNRFASVEEMRKTCGLGWDVVVLFRARNLDTEVWGTSTAAMLRAMDSEAEQRLVESKIVVKCPVLASYVHSFPDKYTHFRRPPRVQESLCVEGERVPSVEHLEDVVFRKRPCVNLLLWARTEKIRLPLRPHLNSAVFQSFTLKHSRTLIRQADMVKHHYLGLNYIGIHVSVLALLRQYGVDYGVHMSQSVAAAMETVRKLRQQRPELQAFLVADLDDSGLLEDNSTTLANVTDLIDGGQKKIENLRQAVFATSVIYPTGYSDYASVSLINAQLLSSGDYLITIGGGSYQEWLVESFRKQHPEYLYTEQLLWRFSKTR